MQRLHLVQEYSSSALSRLLERIGRPRLQESYLTLVAPGMFAYAPIIQKGSGYEYRLQGMTIGNSHEGLSRILEESRTIKEGEMDLNEALHVSQDCQNYIKLVSKTEILSAAYQKALILLPSFKDRTLFSQLDEMLGKYEHDLELNWINLTLKVNSILKSSF